jgi:cytoplasmic iron level regulating protein YaaA (DUF328/UPF0246 family)
MRFLLSPAKTMDFSPGSKLLKLLSSQPVFQQEAAFLAQQLRGTPKAELGKILGVKNTRGLVDLNYARYKAFGEAENDRKMALYAYDGAAYKGLNAADFTQQEADYTNEHLRIISGLYGLLKPNDLIEPYRLDMSKKPTTVGSLYLYWDEKLATEVLVPEQKDEPLVVVNVASQEYFKAVATPLFLQAVEAGQVTLVHCVFKEGTPTTGYRLISFHAKTARGLLVRYAAQVGAQTVAELQGFNLENYAFQSDLSTASELVFTRPKPASKTGKKRKAPTASK